MIPDVIGYPLGMAMELFDKNKIVVGNIKVLKSPKENNLQPDSTFRIVRIAALDDKNIEILVCKSL